MKRALLFINKHSRSGPQTRELLPQYLQAAEIEAVPVACEDAARLSDALLQRSHEADMILIAGGDGAMNAAAKALVETQLPLGILPCGTANDLARTLDIPADLRAAVDIIAQGASRRIDLGRVNDHFFFNVASLGLSAALAQELSAETKRRFGRFGYAIAALRVLAGARPFRAEIVAKGQRARSYTMQIAVGNGRYYGGGNVVEQTARIDDGRLDLYSLEFSTAWRLAFMLPFFKQGAHGVLDDVRAMSGESFEIRTRHPRPINADGELVTHTPAHFQVLPQAISVFAPPAPRNGDPA